MKKENKNNVKSKNQNQEQQQKQSTQIIATVLAIAILIVAVVGISFAAFTYTQAGEKENTVTTGSITMLYSEPDKGIHITDAMPVSDAIGKTYEATDAKNTGTVADDGTGVFDFSVTATIAGTTQINYDIVAVKQTEAKELDGKYVKLYLEKNETSASGEYEQVAAPKRWTTKDEDTGLAEVSEALTDAGQAAGENAKLLHSDSFSGTGGNHYYRLRMWVADDYGEDEASAAAMGEARSFSVKVDVYGQAGA